MESIHSRKCLGDNLAEIFSDLFLESEMRAGGGGSGQLTTRGIMVGANIEARVTGREDAGNGDMMYSGDLRCTMTTGGSVGPPVELEGSSAADAQGSGDTGRSHGTRVGAVPAGTEGGRYEGVACNNGGYRAGKEETRHEQR